MRGCHPPRDDALPPWTKVLPFRTDVRARDAAPDRVAVRIASAVRPRTWFLRVPEGTFYGEMTGWRFELLLDPPDAYGPEAGRFFQPVVVGRIEAAGEGSIVRVLLRPTWSNLVAGVRIASAFSLGILVALAGLGVRGRAAIPASSGWDRLGVGVSSAAIVVWYVGFLARQFRAGPREARGRLDALLGGREQGKADG